MKVTRDLLDSYRRIKSELPMLEQELADMQTGDRGIATDIAMDYKTGQPRPIKLTGFDQVLYERRKTIISNKRAKIKAVEDWINNIEDGQTRIIFRLYYIDGMSWHRIASKTGNKFSPDYPRLYIRDKYLKDCGMF